MEMILESLLVLDRVLDLEQRLVELKLDVRLLMLWGEGLMGQGFRQFRVDPLRRGSEWSLRLNNFDFGLDEEQLIVGVEITDDSLENCLWVDKAATSKAEAADLSEIFADVSTYMTAPQCLDIASAF